MLRRIIAGPVVASLFFCAPGLAQTAASSDAHSSQPLYRVTVVSRTTKAINYGHRGTPTDIDFKGTVLSPDARGRATVESERGATLIKADFSRMPPPTHFGPQYQSYVVWAISPDGRPENLGELMLDTSNRGRLRTSTSLQTFAMIVTAEPHFSVPQPSNAVVMENIPARGTVGRVEEVNATYELLPRGEFTYDASARAQPEGRLVARDEYDAIVALHQAQNALQIAQAQNADRYAPERMARARQLFEQAQTYRRGLNKDQIALAREATQVAEDARRIALKRAEAERVAQHQELQARERAQAEAERNAALAQAQRAREEAEAAARAAERARYQAASEADRVKELALPEPSQAGPAEPISVDPGQFRQDPRATEARTRLLATLGSAFEARDTTRGIVVTMPESMLGSGLLRAKLSQLAAMVQPYRDLHFIVEAHSDDGGPNNVDLTQRRADLIRNGLVAAGLSPNIVMARGLGNSRPLGPNRMQNRRVEIVIAGDAIGPNATWDRPYELQLGAGQ